MSKNFDDTAHFQCEKREEWIREIREKILQEIAEGASNAFQSGQFISHIVPWKKQVYEDPL